MNHQDLNAHNILLQDNKVWLIDFDRGRVMPSNGPWQLKNLKRLLRSLKKEDKKQETSHWDMKNWDYLLEGYHQS